MYKRNSQGWLKHIDFILLDVLVLQIVFILAYMLRHGLSMPYSLEAYRTLGFWLIAADILKRLIDIIGGLFGSIAALIIMAVFAPKIKKESPGPILFKQTRVGLNGKKSQTSSPMLSFTAQRGLPLMQPRTRKISQRSLL